MAYYARSNLYGTPTSAGFDNTMYVRKFATKAERDQWVNYNQDINMAVCKLKSCQVKTNKWGDLIPRN